MTKVPPSMVQKKYEAFCAQHRLELRSLKALAMKMGGKPVARVENYIEMLMDCFPERLIAWHNPKVDSDPHLPDHLIAWQKPEEDDDPDE